MPSPNDRTISDLMSHSEGARRLALSLLRDPHQAEDVAQDALLTAVEKAPRKLINPRAWLYRVTRNQAWASMRKEALRARHERAAARREATSPNEYVDERATMQKGLLEAVLRLPEMYRTVVWMRYFDEASPRVIARELGIPVETVRTRVRRGLERLRSDLDATHGGDREQWRTALLPIANSTSLLGGALVSLKTLSAGGVLLVAALGLVLVAGTVLLITKDDGTQGEAVPLRASATDKRADERPGATLVGRAHPAEHGTSRETGFGPGAGFLDGVVTEPSGRPLAGIRVELFWHERTNWLERGQDVRLSPQHFARPPALTRVAETVSETDGRFYFGRLPYGSYRIHASGKPPRCSTTAFVTVSDMTGQGTRLVLVPGTPLKVRVVDARGEGVRTWVTCTNYLEARKTGYHPWSLRHIPTDAEGRTTLLAPAGRVRLSVIIAGEATKNGLLTEAPRDEELVITLVSDEDVTLLGRVADTDGVAVAGARVAALTGSVGTSLSANVYRATTSDGEGNYRLEGMLVGKLIRLQVAAEGYVGVENGAEPREIAAGETVRVDVLLERGTTLTGTVHGPTGEPIARAEITALRSRSGERLVSSVRTLSGSDGSYRLVAVPPGPGRLQVHAGGYYQPLNDDNQVEDLYEASDDGSPVRCDVTLARGVPVRGCVRDGAGAPVVGARIELRAQQFIGRAWARIPSRTVAHTDAEGRFEFAGLPPSKWTVTATAEQRRSEEASIDTGGDVPPPPLELVVQRGATVSGRVGSNGRPAERLRVHVSGGQGYPNRTVTTAPDGSFRVDALPRGKVEIYAVDWHHNKVSNIVTLDLAWSQVVVDLQLEVEAGGRISGVVVSPLGDPIPDLRVTLNIDTPSSSDSRSVETDDLGRFVFSSVLETGFEYTLSIAYQQKPGTMRPGDEDVRVVHAGVAKLTFEGTVRLPDGSPARAGLVQVEELIPAGPRNGASGTAYGAAIVDGKFSVVIRRRRADATFAAYVQEVRDGRGELVRAAPVRITDVEPDVPIVFELDRGLEIRGVVVDAQGRAVEDVEVRLTPPDMSVMRHRRHTVRTNADGDFGFEALERGTYVINVRGDAPWIRPSPARVEAGETDVRIVLKAGVTIGGRVTDAGGRPVGGARIAFGSQPGSPPWGSAQVPSDADGKFELTGVPKGAVGTLMAAPPRGTDLIAATVTGVRAGQQDMIVTLAAGTWIEGTIVGEDGKAVAHAMLYAVPLVRGQHGGYGTPSADGTSFRIGPVSPGRYRLTVYVVGPYVAPTPLEVEAPAKDLRVVVPRGRLIRGRVVGSENPGAVQVVFHTMSKDGPVGIGGGVTRSGEFEFTLRDDAVGVLYAYEIDGEVCGLVRGARPSDSPITVRLKPGKTIEGSVEGYDPAGDTGQVYLVSSLGLSLRANVNEDGTFRIPRLPDGTYQLGGFINGKQLMTHEDVHAGTKDLVMRFE